MAYQLHIERANPISIDEWHSYVKEIPCLRLLSAENIQGVNSSTKENISIAMQSNPVAIEVNGIWEATFFWRRGKISFNAPASTKIENKTMAAAFKAAEFMLAQVVGDEGEVYYGSL